MHYTFQWRWRSRCDVPTSKHHHRQIQRLSGLKYADSTELNPLHGGSAVTAVASQEEGSGFKPDRQSLHVLSVPAWISSHNPETCR